MPYCLGSKLLNKHKIGWKSVELFLRKLEFLIFFLMWTTVNFKSRSKTKKTEWIYFQGDPIYWIRVWTRWVGWFKSWVRKSRYWGEMLLFPIHCCDVTNPPYLLSGELCTSPLLSNRLYAYTACCRRGGQSFSVLGTRHTDVVGDSSGRSCVTKQGHNVLPLRTRGLSATLGDGQKIKNYFSSFRDFFGKIR